MRYRESARRRGLFFDAEARWRNEANLAVGGWCQRSCGLGPVDGLLGVEHVAAESGEDVALEMRIATIRLDLFFGSHK